jgi:hypothetical protein
LVVADREAVSLASSSRQESDIVAGGAIVRVPVGLAGRTAWIATMRNRSPDAGRLAARPPTQRARFCADAGHASNISGAEGDLEHLHELALVALMADIFATVYERSG